MSIKDLAPDAPDNSWPQLVGGHGDLPLFRVISDEFCLECRQPLMKRLHRLGVIQHVSSRQWFYEHTSHCVICQTLPCFADNCSDRAERVYIREFGVGGGNPHVKGFSTRNDICLCAKHAHRLSYCGRFDLLFGICVGVAVVAAIVAVFELVNYKMLVPLIASALVAAVIVGLTRPTLKRSDRFTTWFHDVVDSKHINTDWQ